MTIHTSRQIKDLVRNLAASSGVEAHVLIRRYMMERLLERISLSPYRDCFILKGGMLVSSLVGVEMRSTMDMDTTVKGLSLTAAEMERVLGEILSISLDDGVSFRIRSVNRIMEEREYAGLRVSLEALLENAITPLKVDISTGDAITPREIVYPYRLMFENRSISLMAYPLETVLAEKLETILTRATLNSRMRDFYDVQVLWESFSRDIRGETLQRALRACAERRASLERLPDAEAILRAVENSPELQRLWDEYRRKNRYSEACTWERVMRSLRSLCARAGLPTEAR